MGLALPLQVTLIGTRGAFPIGREVRDLVFRSTSPGGFASIGVVLDRPLTQVPREIQYYGRCVVSDRRTGQVVCEGTLEDPGRSAGLSGTSYDLTAIGPAGIAKDITTPLIYADTRLDPWYVGGATAHANYIRVDKRVDDDGTNIIQMQAPTGSTFVAGAAGLVINSAVSYASLALARVNLGWRSGFTSSNNEARLGTSLGVGATVAVETDSMSVSSGTLTGSRGGANAITAGHDTVRVRFARITSSIAGADNLWIEFTNPAIRQLLKDKTGTDITSGYSTDTVLSSEVVADLLGRILTLYDGANATITTTSFAINQLAYPDGVTAHQVLEDLMQLDAAYTWHAWEQNSSTGKYKFEFVAWPTTVRYEADARDGYSSQGSADGLYDRVLIRWRDAADRVRTNTRTQTVTVLSDAGRVRQAFIDLGDEIGSSANADRVGDQFLADHASPPNAGRLTIARPVRDLYTGRTVMPWEIRPGQLIRVRGIDAQADSLNATGRDGTTVFRIVSAEFRASSGSADLELDTYSRTTARALADLATRQATRRR